MPRIVMVLSGGHNTSLLARESARVHRGGTDIRARALR
jgi:hypothetical protein